MGPPPSVKCTFFHICTYTQKYLKNSDLDLLFYFIFENSVRPIIFDGAGCITTPYDAAAPDDKEELWAVLWIRIILVTWIRIRIRLK
jgi:hypothetical protein